MTNRAVTLWGNQTTRLWQVICGGRAASMQKSAVHRYVGDTVGISARVHTMLEGIDGIDFLAFVPRSRSGITFPLAQHLSILRHAIEAIATRGLPQEAALCHRRQPREPDQAGGSDQKRPGKNHTGSLHRFELLRSQLGLPPGRWLPSRLSRGRIGPASTPTCPVSSTPTSATPPSPPP